MAKTKKETSSVEMLEPKVYEIGFLLSPAIREEDLDTFVEKIKASITENGGLEIAEGRAEYIDLAYPMQKDIENKRHTYTQAYFGWIKFDMAPDKIAEVKKAVESLQEVIRILLINTVRENTIISKKPLSTVLAEKRNGAQDSEDEVVADDVLETDAPELPELDSEKIDQEIDGLVIE